MRWSFMSCFTPRMLPASTWTLFDSTMRPLLRHVKLFFSNTLMQFWQQTLELLSCCLFLMRRCILYAARAASVSQMRTCSWPCSPNIWSTEQVCHPCQRRTHCWTGRWMAKTPRVLLLLIKCLMRTRRRREKRNRIKKKKRKRKSKQMIKQQRRQSLRNLTT